MRARLSDALAVESFLPLFAVAHQLLEIYRLLKKDLR